MPNRTVDEIKAELQIALQREKAEVQSAQAKVQPRFLFTITPVTDNWHQSFDETVVLYNLAGVLTNADEFRAVGKMQPSEGRMVYAFNTLSGSIIMGVSGGVYFITDPTAMKEISRFLVENPKGGDITDIMNRYRNV
jgi:hypothetical protein